VVGGLYAAGGMRALELLVAENSATGTGIGPTLRALAAGNLNRALVLAPFSSFAVEAFVNATLRAAGATCAGDPPCLGTTEIPFYPVGTNLGTHEPLALPHASAGWGVRMSGSLPPMFSSLLRRHDRIADGAFIANVPSRVLRDVGAHFVIAANVVPPPPERVATTLGRDLVTWLPRKLLERLEDSVHGLFVLAWKAGQDQGALAADYALDLRPTAANLFEMWRGRAIVDDIEARYFTGEKNAQRIRDAWQAFNGDGVRTARTAVD
jgi:predicted acylesterase/phospholipase RssA